jgi:hypothetical protein
MQTPQRKLPKANESSLQVTAFDGLTVEISPNPEHEFVMSNREVAHAYGIADATLRSHAKRHESELTQGTHWFYSVAKSNAVNASNFPIKTKMWTKAGVIRVGMFIRSERAARFRDWAEALILDRIGQGEVKATRPDRSGRQIPVHRDHNRLTPSRIIDLMSDIVQIEDRDIRIAIASKLLGKGADNA